MFPFPHGSPPVAEPQFFTPDSDDVQLLMPVDPVHPLQLYVVPLCLLAALATGSSAGWITWVLSHGRARPVVLYALWLATVGSAVCLSTENCA